MSATPADALETVTLQGEIDRAVGQSVLATNLDFDTVVERVKSEIATAGLWVIAEIDPQMLLRRGGFAIPRTRQILFFHPRYMSRLLTADASAIVEAPLKFVVTERGAGAVLRWPEPIASFRPHPRLAALAEELGGLASQIAHAATGDKIAA